MSASPPARPITFPVRLGLALAAVSLAGLAAACRQQTTPTAQAPSVVVTADTWAVVDGREIKREDIDKAFRRVGQLTLSEEEALTAKLNLLNDYIVQDILLAKARESKVELTDAELDTAYAEARKNIPEEAFREELNRRNLTAADMREGLRRELMTQKVIDREVTSKVAVSDQDVTDFFNANRAQFNFPEESFRIAQIVVTPVRDPGVRNASGDDAPTPEAAANKTQMLMGKLKSGAAFGDLARDYSEDAETAPRGGDLGFVPISALRKAPAPLRDAVLKLSPGSVTVVSSGGAHTIVLLVAREAAGQRDLNTPAVKESITSTLKGRKEQLLRTAYLTTIRSDANVINYLARRLTEGQGKLPSLSPTSPASR
jgi:peptidyl-prolyl cis-trans isomerase SurA